MNSVKVYGHSDDCIEIEGDIDGCDEYYSSGKKDYIVFSGFDDESGDVFSIEFTEDGWEFDHVFGHNMTFKVIENKEKNTQELHIQGHFDWVKFIGPDFKLSRKFTRSNYGDITKAENIIEEMKNHCGREFLQHLTMSERNNCIISLAEIIEE